MALGTSSSSASLVRLGLGACACACAAALLYGRRVRRACDEDEAGGDDDSASTPPVYSIVLTGGPCAGKTTALARLSGYLSERGFRVYTVPEMATIMFANGVGFADLGSDDAVVAMQTAVLGGQLQLEDGFASLAARTGKPAVLLCDRGAMDGSAYMDRRLWGALLTTYGERPLANARTVEDGERALCERYDGVFHLVTAADRAERHYTLENNVARTESPEDARRADAATQRAWARHPRQLIVDNSSSELGFEGKLQRVIDAAAKIVGLPVTHRLVRKFVLAAPPPSASVFAEHGVALSAFAVTKTFLKSVPFRSALAKPNAPRRGSSASSWLRHAYVRERLAPGGARTFGYAEVLYDGDGDVHERKRRILRRESARPSPSLLFLPSEVRSGLDPLEGSSSPRDRRDVAHRTSLPRSPVFRGPSSTSPPAKVRDAPQERRPRPRVRRPGAAPLPLVQPELRRPQVRGPRPRHFTLPGRAPGRHARLPALPRRRPRDPRRRPPVLLRLRPQPQQARLAAEARERQALPLPVERAHRRPLTGPARPAAPPASFCNTGRPRLPKVGKLDVGGKLWQFVMEVARS